MLYFDVPIFIFRFGEYRFIYESIIVWMASKFATGKALLLVATGLLEFAGGVMIFSKRNIFS